MRDTHLMFILPTGKHSESTVNGKACRRGMAVLMVSKEPQPSARRSRTAVSSQNCDDGVQRAKALRTAPPQPSLQPRKVLTRILASRWKSERVCEPRTHSKSWLVFPPDRSGIKRRNRRTRWPVDVEVVSATGRFTSLYVARDDLLTVLCAEFRSLQVRRNGATHCCE